MKKKPIFIVFSDLHLHVYNQFNSDYRRTNVGFDIVERLLKKNVPLLFCGDLFHEDQYISNYLLQLTILKLLEFSEKYGTPIYGISGNHDMSEQSGIHNLSPSFFRTLSLVIPNINHIDYQAVSLNGVGVFGIPYFSYNMGIDKQIARFKKDPIYKKHKKRILLIHTDLYGARDTDGRKINSVENIDPNMEKYFKGFDLIFSGHIHKPQRITKKIIMVGAPNQQRKSDMGGKFGYWEVYEDLSYKFVRMKNPEYRFYIPSKDDIDGYHYWIPLEEKEDPQLAIEEKRFYSTLNREKLAKRYCKTKGIKSKKKIQALKRMLND